MQNKAMEPDNRSADACIMDLHPGTELLKICEESGIAFPDGLCAIDGAAGLGQDDGQGHYDPVVVVSAENGAPVLQGLLWNGDGVAAEDQSAAELFQFFVHSHAPVTFLGLQTVCSGKDRAVLQGSQREQHRAQIGTIGNIQHGSSLRDLPEIVFVYPVTLQTVRLQILHIHL